MAFEHVQDYVTLSDCYDLFNERLFGGKLRGCVLTFEDRGQHFGYYRERGFIDRDGQHRRDEIAPRYLPRSTRVSAGCEKRNPRHMVFGEIH